MNCRITKLNSKLVFADEKSSADKSGKYSHERANLNLVTCYFRHVQGGKYEFRMAAEKVVMDKPFQISEVMDTDTDRDTDTNTDTDVDVNMDANGDVCDAAILRVLRSTVKEHKLCTQTQHIDGWMDTSAFVYMEGLDPECLKKASGLPHVRIRRSYTKEYISMTPEERGRIPIIVAGDSGIKTFGTYAFNIGCTLYIGHGAGHDIGRMLDRQDEIQAKIDLLVEQDSSVVSATNEARCKGESLFDLCRKDSTATDKQLLKASLEDKKARDALSLAKQIARRSGKLHELTKLKDKILAKVKKFVKNLHRATVLLLGDADIVILPTLVASSKSSSEFFFCFYYYYYYFLKKKNK